MVTISIASATSRIKEDSLDFPRNSHNFKTIVSTGKYFLSLKQLAFRSQLLYASIPGEDDRVNIFQKLQ